MEELDYVKKAKSYIGLKEVPGTRSNPEIVKWMKVLKTGFSSDSTPWCGIYMGWVFHETHELPKSFAMAKSWSTVGIKLDKPCYGAVAVYSRVGGGHVGIVVGIDKQGRIMLLSGNSSDAVNIKPIAKNRKPVGYYWMKRKGVGQLSPNASRYELPVLNSNGVAESTKED